MQSTGPSDPWHASHDLLEEAATAQGITIVFEGESDRRYDTQTLRRLTHLGLLVDLAAEEHEVGEYRVAAAMQDVMQAVLEPGPWHTSVRALLDDERADVFPGASFNATEATIGQTKLVAHEVRNALIPVRHEIDALRSLTSEQSQWRSIDDAREGITRVLNFVEAMVQAGELITEPLLRCEIGSVVDEALGWIDTTHRVQRALPVGTFHVVAPRTRLARAISNVVGNALQAPAGRQPVRVSIVRSTGFVRVVVDDGGPACRSSTGAGYFSRE